MENNIQLTLDFVKSRPDLLPFLQEVVDEIVLINGMTEGPDGRNIRRQYLPLLVDAFQVVYLVSDRFLTSVMSGKKVTAEEKEDVRALSSELQTLALLVQEMMYQDRGSKKSERWPEKVQYLRHNLKDVLGRFQDMESVESVESAYEAAIAAKLNGNQSTASSSTIPIPRPTKAPESKTKAGDPTPPSRSSSVLEYQTEAISKYAKKGKVTSGEETQTKGQGARVSESDDKSVPSASFDASRPNTVPPSSQSQRGHGRVSPPPAYTRNPSEPTPQDHQPAVSSHHAMASQMIAILPQLAANGGRVRIEGSFNNTGAVHHFYQ